MKSIVLQDSVKITILNYYYCHEYPDTLPNYLRRLQPWHNDSFFSVLLVVVNKTSSLHAPLLSQRKFGSIEKRYTYRTVVASHVGRLVQLRQDVLCKHFSKLDTHLVCKNAQ